ncbi:MAG: MATE family efflux transporter [Thermodesulfovibrionales bacterium]|nr:MATE family efflux transporter [Thermodesulfovibrionales bacterium]
MQEIKKIITGKTAKTGYWAIIDQAIVSISNFFVAFFLARNISQYEFGIFSLGYAIMIFVNSIQYSIITSPMMVLSAPLEGQNKQAYFSSLAILQVYLGLILTIIMLSIGILFNNFMIGKMIIVMSLIIFMYMGQEYIRRNLFAVLENSKALLNDFICYGTQMIGIVILFKFNKLSWESAFLTIGITSGIALLFGLYQIKGIWNMQSLDLRNVAKKNWIYGKWLLASNLATYTSSQAYLFISALMLGPSASGALRAVQNVFGPTHIFLSGFTNFVPQIATNRYISGGFSKLKEFLGKMAFVLVALIAFYGIIICSMPEYILNLFYKDRYAGYGYLLIIFAISYIVNTISLVLNYGLRVIQKTRVIFNAYIGSSIITAFVSIPLIHYLKLEGAVIGILLAGLFVLFYSYMGMKLFSKEMTR